MSDKITIIVDEEYGFRRWSWDTGMTEQELIQWWVDMDSVEPYFLDLSKTLPGNVVRIDNAEMYGSPYIAHFHMDSDSYLYDTNEKEYIFHKGYDKQ